MTNSKYSKNIFFVAILLNPTNSLYARIEFEEVTQQAGITYIGESWGVAWGDFNGDGFPDIWSGNHRLHPSLYVNNKDGTFTDILPGLFSGNPFADTHGAAWADFDNDGDQDLIELSGGSTTTNINHYNHLYVNENGVLTNKADLLGVGYPQNRGRTPLWLDYNSDGLLDLVTAGAPRGEIGPSSIFKQTFQGSFTDSAIETGFDCKKPMNLALLSDINGNGQMDLLCQEWSFPQKAYDISKPLFMDISQLLANDTFVYDVTIADFNGDLLPDIFTGRFPSEQSNSTQPNDYTIESRVDTSNVSNGVSFKSTGDLSVNVTIPYLKPYEIYIGSTGYNPPRFGNGVMQTIFTISSKDASTHGIKPHEDGIDNGLYIGFDPKTQEWQMLISGNRFQYYWARMVSENPITDLTHIGYDPSKSLNPPRLFLNSGAGYINYTGNAGLATPINCFSNVAGDFDNDMDIDIYMACQHPPENVPNILYENQGDGSFIAVPSAGGAAGSTEGGANNVAIADYDMDGFLDLYVINGSGEPPLTDGPDQLFRNKGNTNHWIEIDLEGVNSNRDGIGAKVYVTAGGKTQLREQNSGIHTWAQNHQRIHFGLAENSTIDNITVEWPSGVKQEINKVSSNQLLHILEPSQTILTKKPIYKPGKETGVFLWKNTFDEPYHLRTSGDGSLTDFDITLLSSKDVVSATPVKTENGDLWDEYSNGFTFYSLLTTGEDGVDFKVKGGSETLLSIKQEGEINPRQLSVGASQNHLTPAGWVLPTTELITIPDFTDAKTGLYIGKNSTGNLLEVYPHSNGTTFDYSLKIITNYAGDFSPINTESNDIFSQTKKHATLSGYIGSGFDGINLNLIEHSTIGIAYKQDDILPSHTINLGFEGNNDPNAYWLPIMAPYDRPDIYQWREHRVFLWKNKNKGLWNIIFTAGNQSRSFSGSIGSNMKINKIENISIESNDIINTANPTSIYFNLFMSPGGHDGFTFKASEDSELQLDITEPSNANHLVLVGKKRWPVLNLPIDISGW